MTRPPATLLLSLALCCTTVLAQDRFAGVKMEAVPVAGAVTMLTGEGGNIGVSAGPDGALVVDDQFEPLAPKIRAALRDLGHAGPTFLLNTHFHGDHTGGNVVFGAEATIIAHANVRKRLGAPQRRRGEIVAATPPIGLPVVTFEDGLSVHFNGEEIRVRHFPASHTDGDAVVHFTGSNVVHLGDLFFSGRFPYVDLDHGGSVEGLIASIATLLEELPEDVRIIPGHGPLSDRSELRTYHRMLVQTSERVRRARAAGKTLEEAQAAGLQDEWEAWGWRFISTERWIETLYRAAGES